MIKNLAKIPQKQRQKIAEVLGQILAGQFEGLDIKKLKGSASLFRVRVGDYRVVYLAKGDQTMIVSISRRNKKTYRDL